MGMILVGRRLDADAQRRLAADPSITSELLHDDNDEHNEDESVELDVDKAWHAIQFLITGHAWDLTDGPGHAILGGDPVGDDVGYGPARLLSPAKVREIADGLRGLDVDTLRRRYDPAALVAADIYPQIWDENDVFDSYVGAHYADLRRFYITAADADQAVLLAMT